MERLAVYGLIDKEREYQIKRGWNDDKNTPHDWITYIVSYLGKAYTYPFNPEIFRTMLVKVAALAVAALERETYAPIKFQEE